MTQGSEAGPINILSSSLSEFATALDLADARTVERVFDVLDRKYDQGRNLKWTIDDAKKLNLVRQQREYLSQLAKLPPDLKNDLLQLPTTEERRAYLRKKSSELGKKEFDPNWHPSIDGARRDAIARVLKTLDRAA